MAKAFHCPYCGKAISTSQYASFLGSCGKGAAKRRSSDQARAAVNVRWARARAIAPEPKLRKI